MEADFGNSDAADHKIGSLTTNKFFIYPFISVQKEFGYSDATLINNNEGRVTELFSKAAETIQHLLEVRIFYSALQRNITIEDEYESFHNIIIPTYIINLPERTERREHIQQQFRGRDEFDITIVEAFKHEKGAVGLWHTIRKIVQMAIDNEDDVIIICEDDHEFTDAYSKQSLIKNIIEAGQQGAGMLAGGIGNFTHAVPLTENRFWISSFWCTQFIVLYRNIFTPILNEPFDSSVTADGLISDTVSNKMVLFPFISRQKDFGYSDATPIYYKSKGPLIDMFYECAGRLNVIQKVSEKYQQLS